MMNWVKRVPWFYIFFAIFPLLHLWSVNTAEIDPAVVVRPFLFTLAGTAILYGVLYLVFRNVNKAAYIGILILLLFFSYGLVYDYLRHSSSLSDLGRHRILIPVFTVTLGLGIWGILSSHRKTKIIIQWLNITCTLLVLFSIIQLGYFYITSASAAHRIASLPTNSILLSKRKDLPDVYFIVLDEYMRADALQAELGFDNSAFINQLENMGFYVAKCSRPNYAFTRGSIASTLNMDYLPDLEAKTGILSSEDGFWNIIKNNEVRNQLKKLGYKTVSFRSEYPWLELTDADVFLGLDHPSIGSKYIYPFETLYLGSTAAVIFTAVDSMTNISRFWIKLSGQKTDSKVSLIVDPYIQNHVNMVWFMLKKLTEIPAIAGPKFVYAHFLVPHAPRVFLPDGEIIPNPDYDINDTGITTNSVKDRQAYIYGVEFINAQIIPVLKSIINESDTPPIIILEGDHGYRDGNPGQYANLSAYYLPNGYDKLYPTITPVNSFRIVFDEYFGANYPLLPDISDGDTILPFTESNCTP